MKRTNINGDASGTDGKRKLA